MHFGAINYRSDVYLNGKKLGTHIGGFTPFNFEITGQLKASDNFIIIRVDNKRAADEVPTVSTDWWNYGGITSDVSIYEFGTTFIEDYNIQLDKNDDDLIKVTILLNGKEKGNQEVIFNIS